MNRVVLAWQPGSSDGIPPSFVPSSPTDAMVTPSLSSTRKGSLAAVAPSGQTSDTAVPSEVSTQKQA